MRSKKWFTVGIQVFLALLLTSLPGKSQSGSADDQLAVNHGSGLVFGDSVPASTSVKLSGAHTAGLDQILQQLESEEYFISWSENTYLDDLDSGYQAPNRLQGFRTYFTDAGVVVIPRIVPDEGLPWRLDLGLKGWGHNESKLALTPTAPAVSENRAEYGAGLLKSWYLNDEIGLTQGFTVTTQLADNPTAEPLIIEMAIIGNLKADLVSNGEALQFSSQDGAPQLTYSAPHAYDASGASMQAWLVLAGSKLELFVDAGQAVYPIQIETLIVSVGETPYWSSGPAPYDYFRDIQVATAGDVNNDGFSDILIGAPYYDGGEVDEGRVWAYLGSAAGVTLNMPFAKESNQVGALYGYSVSTAGDVNNDYYADIIVGAPGWHDGETGEGGAWIYHGNSGGITSAPARYLQGGQAGAAFGSSVAFAGTVNADDYSDVIIGAPLYTNGQTEEGRVYVYHGSASGIEASPSWQAENDKAGALLGCSVSTAGDINGDGYMDIIVGASMYNNGQADEGKAYVWYGSHDGVNGDVDGNDTNAPWQKEGDQISARLGFSVSTAGDVNGDSFGDVIVGAPLYTNGHSGEGAAWVYLGTSSGLMTSYDNMDEGNQIAAHFGWSVAMAGDVNGDGFGDVIVGAPDFDASATDDGAAYVWYGHYSGISSTRDWDGSGGTSSLHYGKTVATAGDVNGDGYSEIFIGAPGAAAVSGWLYIYKGGPDDVKDSADWVKASGLEDSQFGFSVSTAGDVNGDGYSDLIVGAPYWDAGQPMEGRVHIYKGSSDGLLSAPLWYKGSAQAYAGFGFSVGLAGDVDNDGYDDVIVGSPFWQSGSSEDDEGGAWVYRGTSTEPIDAPYWHVEGAQEDAHLGWSVAGAGDVNGDGYADVIVGAPDWDSSTIYTNSGIARIYMSRSNGIATSAHQSISGGEANAYMGYSVASAGDVNRDGFSDVIIGAPGWDDDVANEGRAIVLHGSASGLPSFIAWHAEANSYNAQLGYSVGSAGDVNGDGYSDVIVGAPYYNTDADDATEGKVYVFHGSGSGLSSTAAWSKLTYTGSAKYGYAVSTAGDVNGDGYADVIIGSPGLSDTITNEGTARVYLGSGSGLGTSPVWFGAGGEEASWYGSSVGTAGDTNGDGYADVFVGSPQYGSAANPPINAGRVHVYFGGGGLGVNLNPRQKNSDGSLLAHLGQSKDPDSFRIYLRYKSPFWESGASLGAEYINLTNPFLGTGTYWLGYYSATNGSEHYLPTSNLAGGEVYHWRMRLYYDKVDQPYLPASRWLAMPYHGWNEADLRTPSIDLFLPTIIRQ